MKLAALVALSTGTVAWLFPGIMLGLWPEDDAALYLMEAWGIYCLVLGLLMIGMDLKAGTAVALILSIPFDLRWGGIAGSVAAVLNFALMIELAWS